MESQPEYRTSKSGWWIPAWYSKSSLSNLGGLRPSYLGAPESFAVN